MGLENITPDAQPDQLVDTWPTTKDPKNQGDDHIRNIKLTLKNFFAWFQTEMDKFNNYFDGSKVKLAKDSDKLGGQPPNYYLDPNNLQGTIPRDRLPTATSTQLGAVTLSSTRNTATDVAATPKLIKEAVDEILASGGASDVLKWTHVTITNDRAQPLPAGIMAILDSGDDVEVSFSMFDSAQAGGQYMSDQVIIFHDAPNAQMTYAAMSSNTPYFGWQLSVKVGGGGTNVLTMPPATSTVKLFNLMYRRAKRG